MRRLTGKRRESRGSGEERGLISILLALLLIPCVILSDALIETAGYHAVTSTVEEVMDSSAVSVLAHYDRFLMNRFGLSALSPEADPEELYGNYYEASIADVSWETEKIRVRGQYALSDREVLENNILESAKYSVPTEMIGDALVSEIADALRQVQGLTSFCASLNTAAGVVGSVADTVTAVEELKEAEEELETALSSYEDRFRAFQSAAETWAQTRDGLEEEEGTAEETEGKEGVRKAAAEYASAIKKTKDSLEKVSQRSKSVLKNLDTAASSARKAAESGTQVSSAERAMENGIQGFREALQEGMKGCDQGVMQDGIAELGTLYQTISAFSPDDVSDPFESSAYYVNVKGYAPSSSLEAVLLAAEGLVGGAGESVNFWTVLKGLSAALNGMFRINSFYDPSLDAVIDESLLGAETDGLSRLITVWEHLSEKVEDASDGGEASSLGEKLRTLQSFCTNLSDILTELDEWAADLSSKIEKAVTKIGSGISDRILLAQYMNLSLANRTTYKKKDVLTGYSFRKILNAASDPADTLFAVGALSALYNAVTQSRGGSDEMFCGAETEYLICGSSTEISNQALCFLRIYLLRLLLDAPALAENAQVAAVEEAAAASTLGIGGTIVHVLYMILEPYLDTVLIANGIGIDFGKNCVYLTPDGILTLMNRLTEIGLSEEQEKEIVADFAQAIGADVPSGSSGKRADAKGALQASYADYLFVFLLLGNRSTLLERFQNVMILEERKYYGEFDLTKSYTYLSVNVSGEYVPFFGAAQLVTTWAFAGECSQVRGY